jgi:RimJ/RimL family protein N-acetyltransferase
VTVELLPAEPDDVQAIMKIEWMPAYAGLIGRWERERHLDELANPSSQHLVWKRATELVGFVILMGLGNMHRKTRLRRIAVSEAGKGEGTRLLRATANWVFGETDTNRLDLDVFVENERAVRAYTKVGFQVDGTLRDCHRDPDGAYRSMYVMSLLRREWTGERRS